MKTIREHSRRVSAALLRISLYIRREEFKKRLEKGAFNLIENIENDTIEGVIHTIEMLRSWIYLGRILFEIEPVNAAMLEDELRSLEVEIRQKEDPTDKKKVKVEIADILKQNEYEFPEDIELKIEKKESYPAKETEETNNQAIRQSGNSINRQSAILEAMRSRESGKVHLKDLTAAFPDVSERTLRYDLQRLAARGVIERIGGGGPSTFYVIK